MKRELKGWLTDFRRWVGSVLLILSLLVLWDFVAGGPRNPLGFPGPFETLERLRLMAFDGYRGNLLHEHLWASLSKVLVALGLGVVTGLPLALLIGRFPFISGFLAPPIYFVRALPPLGYYSLLIVLLGIGDMSKIVLLYLAALPPIVISTHSSLATLPDGLEEVARILGSRGVHFLFRFLLPGTLKGLFSGVRIAAGFALSTIVAAEIVAADSGIGWVILDASRYLQFDVVLAGIVALGAMALAFDWILGAVETRLIEKQRKRKVE